MDQVTFHQWLKNQGRTEEVAERVIRLVAAFSDFLCSQSDHDMGSTQPRDVETFVIQIEKNGQSRAAKSFLWALRYYFQYSDQQFMVAYTTQMREARITRKQFLLRNFQGVDLDQISLLEAVGIKHTDHLLKSGNNQKSRQTLAEQIGLSIATITELVKLSDLARIAGIKGIRARLYFDAGVDTLENLASWDPNELHGMLLKFIARTGFIGSAPQPAEVLFSITTAKALPKLVEYE